MLVAELLVHSCRRCLVIRVRERCAQGTNGMVKAWVFVSYVAIAQIHVVVVIVRGIQTVVPKPQFLSNTLGTSSPVTSHQGCKMESPPTYSLFSFSLHKKENLFTAAFLSAKVKFNNEDTVCTTKDS